jgi:hypothetical protein
MPRKANELASTVDDSTNDVNNSGNTKTKTSTRKPKATKSKSTQSVENTKSKKETKTKNNVVKTSESKSTTSTKGKTPCKSSCKKVCNESTNECKKLTDFKKEWVSITQEITKLRNMILTLEDKRMVITHELSKLMEIEDSDNTIQKPPVKIKKQTKTVSKKNIPVVTHSDDELSDVNTSDSSSSESESDDNMSEVSLSDSSESLSDSSDDEP